MTVGMNNAIELKPCPFCGKSPRLNIHEVDTKPFMYFTDRYCVLCDYNEGGCGTEGPHRKDKDEAISLWNTRTTLSNKEKRK